jgi:hypothetical protein
MTAQLVHVGTADIYVLLSNSKIVQIQKNTNPRINPHAICVDCFDATTGQTHVVEREPYFGSTSKLCLDAADLVTFAAWLGEQMPRASSNAFGSALERLFPGSMHFRDVLAAAIRAAGVPGVKRAAGEQVYFMERARASDPEGFAELAAKYAASTTPKVAQ